MKNTLLFYAIIVLFISCTGNHQKKHLENTGSNEIFNFKTTLSYAKGFTVENHQSYKLVRVNNPWTENKLFGTYVIIKKGSRVPEKLPQHDFLVEVPVEKVAPLSSTHIGPLSILNARNTIIAATEPDKIFDSLLYAKYENGKLQHLGSAMDHNMEKIFELSPDVVFKSGFHNAKSVMERIEEAGIPVAYNVEWMENNLLARAEWIKFMALFLDKEKLADSLFNDIVNKYNNYKQVAAEAPKKPTVMYGMPFQGTWYTPGGKSYIALLFDDANADYFYKNDTTTGSYPISFEVMLEDQLDAEFWIGPHLNSKQAMLENDERFGYFNAFKGNKIYNFSKRINPNGGNDYWESGIVHPELILADLIKIFHPSVLPEHDLFYFQQLKEE